MGRICRLAFGPLTKGSTLGYAHTGPRSLQSRPAHFLPCGSALFPAFNDQGVDEGLGGNLLGGLGGGLLVIRPLTIAPPFAA